MERVLDKETHHHKAEADALWKESSQNELIGRLNDPKYRGKRIMEMVSEKTKEKISQAFSEKPCSCGCSDGRIHTHRLGRAGMGILAGEVATADALEKMIANGEVRMDGKDGFIITSHDGCGAAKIVCQKMIFEGKLPEGTDPDSLGVEFAKNVVAILNERGVKATWRHTQAGEMDDFHNERAIYLDGTGKLNIEDAADDETDEKLFPRGFIFSDLRLDRAVTVAELKALSGIARGDHGFGNRFNKNNPFYIIIAARNEAQYEELKAVADEAADDSGGVVRVVRL